MRLIPPFITHKKIQKLCMRQTNSLRRTNEQSMLENKYMIQ